MRSSNIRALSKLDARPVPFRPAVDNILELVRSRSSPGVLIMGLDNRIVYSNREALGLFSDPDDVPVEVIQLCERVKTGIESGRNCALLWLEGESPYSMRAFLIGGPVNGQAATHVMVLVERFTEQHEINLKRARTSFGLSDREIEVVALVAEGLANKDIGIRLFVSEHTVKDHLKNISRKMGATRRSEIIAMLK